MDIDIRAMCDPENNFGSGNATTLKIMYYNNSTAQWTVLDWAKIGWANDALRTIKNDFHITQGEKIRTNLFLDNASADLGPGGTGDQDSSCEMVISENVGSSETRWWAERIASRSEPGDTEIAFDWDATDSSGDWEDATVWVAPRDMDIDIRAMCDAENNHGESTYLRIMYYNVSTAQWIVIDWGRSRTTNYGTRTIKNNFSITQGGKIRTNLFLTDVSADLGPGGHADQDTACEMVISEVPSE